MKTVRARRGIVAWGLRTRAWERLVRVRVRHETRGGSETGFVRMLVVEAAEMLREAWRGRHRLVVSTSHVLLASHMGLEVEIETPFAHEVGQQHMD